MGARLLKRWTVLPLKDIIKINERLQSVEFFIKETDTRQAVINAVKQCGDIERLVSKIPMKKINPREVMQLAKGLQQVALIKNICAGVADNYLKRLSDGLNNCHFILDKILNEIIETPPVAAGKGNFIKQGIHEELDKLRSIASGGKEYLINIQQRESEATGIPSLKISFNNVFGYYLEVTNVHKNKVPAEWIRKQTLANAERYITPELKEYEEKITGSEEKILAIELEMYNNLLIALQDYIAALQANGNIIAVLDCLCCFAENALRFNYKNRNCITDYNWN